MAKQEKELTVEERLKALYNLQKILSEVDRIKTLRGELPLEVQDLEDEIAGLHTRIGNYEQQLQDIDQEVVRQTEAKEHAASLIEKYTSDQDRVQNNREYDFLLKEIEYNNLNIELAEKRINEMARKKEAIASEIEKVQELLADREHVIAEKKNELSEIVSETKQDEEKLREQAKRLENKIDTRLLTAFKRIRKNTRNGLGIVYVQRNACGGCFNRVPAQRQSEIKMHKKIIVCEYCGRILIDPTLAGVSAAEAKNE